MDVLKLFEKVVACDEVQDIPLMYIFIVVTCVMDVISSGECFYSNELE